MRNLYISFLLFFSMAHVAMAQNASQYYFKHKTGVSLENISSGATTLLGNDQDAVVSAPVSFFPFRFAGTEYSSFSVSEDGVVVLGNAAYAPFSYDNYFLQSYGLPPTIIDPVFPILLPWGEDLITGASGSIVYKITGEAPVRKLIIQFNVHSVEGLALDADKVIQVSLSEGSNQIQFVYGDIAYDWENNANIGIAASASDFVSVNTADNSASSTTMYANEYGTSPYSPVGTYSKGMLPNKGYAYIFSPTEIKDEPTTPVVPVSATLSLAPEYPVAGQHKHTIYLGYGAQAVKLQAQVAGGNPTITGYTYTWNNAAGTFNTTEASPMVNPQQTTTYTVTINDGNGNMTTKSITVHVIDPREGAKFKVCKLGKTTICISQEAVNTQLQGGALLGDCTVALNPPSGTTSANGSLSLRPIVSESSAPRNDMSVYPNPSIGEFTVQIPAEMQQGTIIVFDANGRMVAQHKAGENQQSVHIALQNKKPGVYLIKLTGSGRVQTSKIVIK